MCFNCKLIWIFIILVVVGLFGLRPQAIERPPEISQAVIGREVLDLEIADTVYKQTRGLSGRIDLTDTYGMLFVFPNKHIQTFWMKDMLVPIDIIWIDNNIIIGYEKNVLPEPGVADHELKLYKSPGRVDKVLEVRAGLVQEKNWQVGDVIIFK